ncbi:Nectin-1 [Merluccius polli]|uniref:Nectin-1 n=1 Tax=Merluccius polli TaxID=89951 RepID=A0AA47N258_MERPO|nr:Nectin-1 [Merluccius polli]
MERTGLWILLISCAVRGTHGQSVEMDADKSGYVGSKVDLRCRFLNSSPPVKISQVTWQKVVNGSKQNVAIANPSLGVSVAPPFRDRVAFKSAAVRRRTPALEDTTLTFSALRLADDAMYICEYTTFPAGNRESTVNLTVFARPTTQMSLSSPSLVARASNVKTPVATCTSANGKPPGTIRWETRVAGGEATSREFRNADGTVTVQSEYMLVPSKDTHRETLTCVTTYNDEEVFTDSVTLDIQYEPDVSVEGFDGNWYLNRENVQLSCQVDANPRVTLYQWKLVNGTMPSSVEVQDNTLTFSGPLTYDLEGTYVCDATNSIGTRSASVEVSIIEKPLPQIAAGDVISVVALLLAAGVLMGITVTVLVLKIRSRKDGDSSDSPSSKLSQPVRKRPGDDFQRMMSRTNVSVNLSFVTLRSGSEGEGILLRAADIVESTVAERFDSQMKHAGKFYEELPNTADYHPYAPADPGPAAAAAAAAARPAAAMNQAASRNTFSPPSHTTAIFKYPSMPGMTSPPPGVAPYTFPKEQYV